MSTKETQLAELLKDLMNYVGVMDDYDEIIKTQIYDNVDMDEINQYHERVMTGLTFINETLNTEYDITRDGSGSDGNYSVHMIYLHSLKNKC